MSEILWALVFLAFTAMWVAYLRGPHNLRRFLTTGHDDATPAVDCCGRFFVGFAFMAGAWSSLGGNALVWGAVVLLGLLIVLTGVVSSARLLRGPLP